jgi:hypothetical protein
LNNMADVNFMVQCSCAESVVRKLRILTIQN